MKTNLIKRIITIAAAVAVTFAIGAGGVFAQGVVPDNGIVKDGNLVWLKNANCFNRQDWSQATNSAASLKSGSCGLTDGSKAGDWRLPTIDELKKRTKNTQGFNYVQYGSYWSSSRYPEYRDCAWILNTHDGGAYGNNKFGNGFVWPVRSAK